MESRAGQGFDVFLSHHGEDKDLVERVAGKLKRAGLEPWLDAWHLSAGDRWQDEIAAGLAASSACAALIGPHDLGAWAREELALAADRAAHDRAFRLFLVLLPGVPDQFDAAALTPFLSTRTWVDLRAGIDDARGFQALINGIKGIPLGPDVPIEPSTDVCPYRGLQSFDEEHAEFFFGRDADIQRLVEKLKTTSFLAVLGPSGSGKSSLVLAGLIPALRRGALPDSEDWPIRVVRPGAHPLDALCGHLLAVYPDASGPRVREDLARDPRALRLIMAGGPTRVVCVVDQFEEAFSLCRDTEERSAFIANLLHASTGGGAGIVVLTLRADFYPRCAAYPELAQQMSAHQVLVGPMSEEALRQAVDEPARRVGLEFEPGLIDTVLEDVSAQPGALPLLEHALLELWNRRRGNLLTLEAYREAGGVAGAVAMRAETTFREFTPEQQEIARRAFIRLTQPGEGTEDTRRRARLSELVTRPDEDEAVEAVIRSLVATRMLTAGDEWVDVSHEALIRGWPRLRGWLDEDRAGLRIHRRISEAANDWDENGRDESLLFRGARLTEATDWRGRSEEELNATERVFLDESAALVDRERAKADEQVQTGRRARRLRFAFVLGVCLALTVPALDHGRPDRTLENSLLNKRLDIAGRPHADDVVVVGIDDRTIHALGFPLKRSLQGKVLDRLHAAGARAVAMDIQFTEQSTQKEDNALIEAVRRTPHVVLAATEAHAGNTGVFGGGEGLRYSRATVGFSAFKADADGKVRRMPDEVNGLRGFDLVAAEVATGRTVTRDGDAEIAFAGPAGTVPSISYIDVLRRKGALPPVRDKVVVVGATAKSLQDFQETPEGLMSGPELHAQAIHTALSGFPVQTQARGIELALIFLLGVGVPLACLRVSPLLAAAIGVGVALVYAIVAQLLLDGGTIVTFLYPLAALLLASIAGLLVELRLPKLRFQRLRAAVPAGGRAPGASEPDQRMAR